MPGDNNIESINRAIAALRQKLTPDKELMNAISEEMLRSVEANFETEGRNVPGGWPAMAPSTLKAKQKDPRAILKMLQRHGQLMGSLHNSSTDNEAVVSAGHNLAYAAIHNFGGAINIQPRTRTLKHKTDAKGNLLRQGKNNNLLAFAKNSNKRFSPYTFGQRAYSIKILARPFMVLTDAYRENIIRIIKNHIAAGQMNNQTPYGGRIKTTD